ncbi:MAG TPA: glycoside hydrolase family 16 protein [Polyangiaceae bacterium]
MHTRTKSLSTATLLSCLLIACSGPSLVESMPQTDAGGAGNAPPSAGSAGSAGAGAGGAETSNTGAGGASSAGSPSYAGAGSAGAQASLPGSSLGSGGSAAGAGGGGSAGAGGGSPALPPGMTTPSEPGWTLAWSDEFNASDGSSVDDNKWAHAVGGDGWGNQELEYYTSDTANSLQRGGNLVINATRDGAQQHSCWNGACQFTSARLLTSGKFSASYGRVEARIKVPTGKGIWPAFWMLGDNVGDPAVGWPACGEIDIMEIIGSDSATLHGSLHGPGYSGGSPLTAVTKLPSAAKLSDDFHRYSVEWAPDSVKFYLDDMLYEKRTPADIPPGTKWVYDHPFFIILNLSVGGQWPGSPDSGTAFPAQMLVDYVRVFKAS